MYNIPIVIAPKTREKTPFYKLLNSKLFTKTKLPTFIDIYYQ